MPRTILCSAGTSVAQGCKALATFQNRETFWAEDTSELAERIRERLKGFDLRSEAGRVKASAELNALHRLPVRSDDEVVLFVTDTADGRCCAEAVKDVLAAHFGVVSVTIERIKGLQVRDADRLRREGLINLTHYLINYLDDPQRRYAGACLLNTNGGFKGLVPFFAILGMIYRAPVVYVFEFAECLITLPPLPIGFATELFERALPAIRWAQTQDVFNAEDFLRRIPGFSESERELFNSFLEIVAMDEKSAATLSPLINVLAKRELEGACEIWLSPEATKKYGDLRGDLRSQAEAHFRKLPSPLWKSQHRATKYESDLEFYPEEKSPNPWRFAGFTENARFYLAWFTNDHNEYLRRIKEHQRADYQPSTFTKLDLPAKEVTEALSPGDPDRAKTWLDLRDECQKLRQQLAEANPEESASIAKLNKKIKGLESQIVGKDRKISNLAADKRRLEGELQRQEAAQRLVKKLQAKGPRSA